MACTTLCTNSMILAHCISTLHEVKAPNHLAHLLNVGEASPYPAAFRPIRPLSKAFGYPLHSFLRQTVLANEAALRPLPIGVVAGQIYLSFATVPVEIRHFRAFCSEQIAGSFNCPPPITSEGQNKYVPTFVPTPPNPLFRHGLNQPKKKYTKNASNIPQSKEGGKK